MKDINKKKNSLLVFSILLTIGLPLGVLLIIFGFSYAYFFLGSIGIALAAFGFYVMPILWIKYSEYRLHSAVCSIIIEDNQYCISVIAQTLAKNKTTVLNSVKLLLSKRYLKGFALSDNDNLVNLEEEKNKQEVFVTKKCTACGAVSELAQSNPICPYCGTINND